ncbi:MAG: flagellar motor protein MotB [Sutterellaceae bacterium]|nr:flagellar motor protein MotB [Burkholderiaceae bacterium]MDW8431024.1 flagellar motor protein MotB [Sutterellaceae bacterium]
MPASEKAKSTIVIKRIKKGGHGHHGGVWKIAYADFVTAMMAFFLLMWLLGSTTKGDLKGIAEYFASPLQIALMGGSGAGDATSVIQGGGVSLTDQPGQVKRGDTEEEQRKRRQQRAQEERARMEALKAKVEAALFANPKLAELRKQIRIEITPDGLRIQIVDDFERPMFALGSAQVQPYMRDLLREIGAVLNQVDNKIALSGHTDAAPYASGERGYSNWELSADRANASRRELIAGGMEPGKIVRVVGLADSNLLVKDDPRHPLNRRISIIVLNKLAEERLAQAGGEIEAGTGEDVKDAVAVGSTADYAAKR